MPQRHSPQNGRFISGGGGSGGKSVGAAKAQGRATGQSPVKGPDGKSYPAGTRFHNIGGKIHALSPKNHVPTPGRGGR